MKNKVVVFDNGGFAIVPDLKDFKFDVVVNKPDGTKRKIVEEFETIADDQEIENLRLKNDLPGIRKRMSKKLYKRGENPAEDTRRDKIVSMKQEFT